MTARYRLRSAAFLSVALLVSTAWASDWPCYRKDSRRSSVTAEKLPFPLAPKWIRTDAPPRPAWVEPGRAINPLDFDRAYEPVSAGGLVYIASSATDTLYALRAADGSIAWTHTADAPLRFAPHIDNGRCYLAGDDGLVVCLDAQNGTPVWTYRPVATQRMLAGNGRMISRWPCRTGVLVQNGIVYSTAGMWPAEGTCYFALDAKTGAQVWCTDTTDSMYVAYPHDGLSRGGPTPQGYLVSDERVLIVPTGLSGPAGFDVKSGRYLFWHTKGPGSTWACAGDDVLMMTGIGWQNDQDIRLGEGPLWEGDGLAFFSLPDGKHSYDRKWNGYAALPSSSRKAKERLRGQIDPIPGRDRAVWAGDTLYLSGMNKVEAVEIAGALRSRWCVDHTRVYALALAGDTLLAGGDRTVTAFRASDGNVVWKAEVDGQARGLAVANGQLYVTTDRGTLYTFGAGAGTTVAPAKASAKNPPPALPEGIAAKAWDQGFAVVAGANDTAIGEALAARTQLNVICLLRDPAAVAAARKRLLDQGYGTGIVVHAAPSDGRLPYADFFANTVVAAGDGGCVAPAELYRILHPCSGRMYLLDGGAAGAFVKQAGIPQEEFKTGAGCGVVSRGPLAGAFDWNTKNEADERVRWPLEMLWFGGPGRDRMLNRHNASYPPPVPAHGRFFVQGALHVIAVDAYNGTELWSHYLPGYRHIAADAEHAYIGVRDGLLVCDAQTGRVLKTTGTPRPSVIALDAPRSFETKKGSKYAGTLRIAKTADAIELQLDTTTPTPEDRDQWMLFFDFRDPAERLNPPGRGCFPLFVATKSATIRRYDLAAEAIAPTVSIKRVEGAPNRIAVQIPLSGIRELTGKEPTSFDLSAELDLFQVDRRWLADLPITNGQDPLHNGTATFTLSGAADANASPWAKVEKVAADALPAYAKDWGREPHHKRHDGNIPIPPVAAEKQAGLKERLATITQANQERRYLRAYGCSGTVSSATADFFRSGTLGVYDLADDSGMRNFPGLKPGCRLTMSPALGVLFSAEGNADCFCPYSFATSLALAPAAQQRNEDWALYYGPTKAAPVKRIALNLGAPGDRRDKSGTLWLGYPRPPMGFATGGSFGPEAHTVDLPLSLKSFGDAQTVRVNTDRLTIAGAESPWVYGSTLQGIRSMQFGMTYYDPRSECLAYLASPPPQIDGKLSDACWAEDPGIPANDHSEQSRVRLRHDGKSLFVSCEDPNEAPAKESPAAKKPARTGRFEVLLKDSRYPLAVRFEAKAGGGAGQSVSCAVDVPKLTAIAIDGKDADWGKQGMELGLSEDRGTVRVGWTPEGLAFLTTLPREFFSGDKAWTSLRMHLTGLGTASVIDAVIDTVTRKAEMVEASLAPDGPGRTRDLGLFRNTKPANLNIASGEAGDGMTFEFLVPFDRLGVKGAPQARVGLKMFAFNPKIPDVNITSGGGSRRALAENCDVLVLTLAEQPRPAGRLKAGPISREWFGAVVRHAPPPVNLPADAWSGAASTAANTTISEVALPLALLDAQGISREHLEAVFAPGEAVRTDPAGLASVFRSSRRVALRPDESGRGTCTVRLHFAELSGAAPGERVFSIRLQGKTAADNVDVVKEAGGPHKALVKTFPGISAGRTLDVEFVPASTQNEKALPILNGIEVISETP